MKLRLIYTFIIAVFISACSSTAVIDTPAEPKTDGVEPQAEPLAMVEITPLKRAQSQSSNAVTSILINARSAMQKGKYRIAAAQLERAVRIEPRNALLWHYLAKVRFNQGRYSLAANLASKSTLLAQDDQALRSSNASLIKQAQATFKIK